MFKIKNKYKFLRNWPYPYKGALSISSDVDFTNFEFFDSFMNFLNTKNNTLLGRGLGLDVTSSIFFYGLPKHTFSYYSGLEVDAKKSQYSERLDDYMKNGLIDSNHAFGDFNYYSGFTRGHAERVYKQLHTLGVKLNVFINHGDTKNTQNILKNSSHHQGDRPESPSYHTDLFVENGVKYVWSEDLSVEKAAPSLFSFNKNKCSLKNCLMQDKKPITSFQRFRGTSAIAPNLSTLRYQFLSLDLNSFYKNNNYVILYQHLGVLNRSAGKCLPSSIEAIKKNENDYLSTFYKIKDEKESGNLWVAGLSNLLNYIRNVEEIEINKAPYVPNTYYISGSFEEGHDFSGLTFYIDPKNPINIYINDKKVLTQINGLDETGKYSATIVDMRNNKEIW